MISDPTTGQPLDLQTTDGTTSMWVIDGTGSPAAAIADTGATAYTVSYDPYGTETISTDGAASAQWQQNPYGFKGGVHSSSSNGMTKFGYRWQTSGTGGWLQRDTLDAPLSPSNANRYAYAGDDPINKSDPRGYSAAGDQVGIFAGAVAGIATTAAVCAFKAGVGCAAGASLGIFLGSAVGGAAGEAAGTAYDGGSGEAIGNAALDGLGKGAEAGFLPALIPLFA